MNKNQKGFGAIEAILILVIVAVIGFVGWYVWKQNQEPADKKTATTQQSKTEENKETEKPVDTYAGWLSCKDTSEGLMFKYPTDWSTEATTKDNPCGIATPANASMDGAYVRLQSAGKDVATSFKLFYSSSAASKGTYNYVDPSYKGETVLDVVALSVPNAPKPLSLVAYAVNSMGADKVAGLVLTDQTYTVGQKLSGSIPFPASKKGGKTIHLSASLAKKDNNQSTEYNYTFDDYKKHADYQTVVNLFKSISY